MKYVQDLHMPLQGRLEVDRSQLGPILQNLKPGDSPTRVKRKYVRKNKNKEAADGEGGDAGVDGDNDPDGKGAEGQGKSSKKLVFLTNKVLEIGGRNTIALQEIADYFKSNSTFSGKIDDQYPIDFADGPNAYDVIMYIEARLSNER